MSFFIAQEFNDFWDALKELNDKFLLYKKKSVTISGGHVTQSDMPVPRVMNDYYERNLDKLATLTNPKITLNTRTWKARDVYSRADFIHMVGQLKRLEDNLEAEINHTLYCGTFNAGTDRVVQTFGRRS